MTEKDYVLVTACADALSAFFHRHSPDIAGGSVDPVSASFTIKDLPGKPTVKITAPHPDAEWLDEEDEDDLVEAFNDDDVGIQMGFAREIVAEFLAAKEKEKKDGDWLGAASFLCEDLFHFKVNFADGVIDDWTAVLVEEYMLGYFPRKVSADEDLVGSLPDVLTEFFAWMLDTGRVSKRSGEAIQKRIKSKTKRFVREASNPSNFGMAKSLMMSMKDAGIDITNQSEVNGFVKAHNASLGDGPPLLDNPFMSAMAEMESVINQKPESEPRRPAQKRWAWSGDGAAPDPKAPCPCGSGKRYKKCCMPR